MEQPRVAGNKYQPPEWAIYALAVLADLTVAANVIPSAHLTLFRSGALFLLHKDWVLALACGFLLPRSVPLTVVCFLKHQWEAFKLAAKARLKRMAENAQDHVAAAAANSGDRATGDGNSHTHRSRRQAEGEVSGYDVSNVSGEEVVELSSWAPESKSSDSGPGVRRRGALR